MSSLKYITNVSRLTINGQPGILHLFCKYCKKFVTRKRVGHCKTSPRKFLSGLLRYDSIPLDIRLLLFQRPFENLAGRAMR